jgi:hypothetical protein
MKKKSLKVSLAVWGLILLLPVLAVAAPVGKITALEGDVDITAAGKIKPGQLNDPVNTGDVLRSKANSKARVTFDDGNELWIAEKTRLKITQYQNEPGEKSFFDLFRGKARSVVSNLKQKATFEIHTPTAICGVRGTIFIGFFQNGQSGFVFEQGQGYGYNPHIPTQVVTISAGQSMTVTAPENPPVVRQVSSGEIQKHVQDTSAAPPNENDGNNPPPSGDQNSGGTSNQGQPSGASDGGGAGTQGQGGPLPNMESGMPVTSNSTIPLPSQLPTIPVVIPQDVTAPVITVTSTPPALTNASTATFSYRANEISGFEYRLDRSAWQAAGAPTTASSLTISSVREGSHTFELRARDPAGNISTPASYSWTTDYTGPAFSVSGMPSGSMQQGSAGIDIAGESGATYTYRLDGGSWVDTGTSISLTGLTEGAHNIQIKATDALGNASAPATSSWTVDNTPPAFSVSGVPSGTTNRTSAGISVTGETGATYAFSLDNGSWITTGASIALTGLTEGAHGIQIKATDAAGNVSGISGFNWTIDSLPPSFNVSGVPSGTTSQRTASISMTGETGATYSYSLDNGGWMGTGESISLTGLAEGAHSIRIRATDASGNISSPMTYSWATDFTAPSFIVSGVPFGTTGQHNASIIMTGEPGATYAYTLDNGGWITTATSITLTGIPEGAHSIQIRATDAVGNVSAPASFSWTTDYTGPSFSASGMPSGTTNQDSANITLTGDAGTTYMYSLDGGSSTTTSGTITLAGLSNGSHTFTVQGTDAVGNTTTKTYNWTVNVVTDTTPPVITIASKSASTTAGGSTTIAASLTADESASFSSKLNGGAAVDGSSPNFTNVASGAYTLEVTATDDEGNSSTKSVTFTLENHAVSGTFSGIGGTSCNATGNVAGVLDNNWGGWNIAMTGTAGDPPANWNMSTGGKNPDNSYWLSVAPGTTNTTTKTLAGTSNLIYLSPTRLGRGGGTLSGSYDGVGNYTLTDTNIGGYTEKPLKFMSQFNGDLVSGLTYPSIMTIDNTPVTITLNWGATPLDLDSHLWVPPNSSANHIHVYYDYKGTTHNSPFAELDLDDTNGHGPETITVSKLRNGTYYYSVYNFSGSPAINTSGAYVEISDGSGPSYTFYVPTTGTGRWYNVFYLVDDTVYSINSIGDANTYEAGLSAGSGAVVGSYSAILGSDTLLWGMGSPVSFYVLGSVMNLDATRNFVFQNAIYSSNATALNCTTYDGGAYTGWMSGILGNSVEGVIYAFYREPRLSGSSNMGIMKGSFSGSTYPGIGMWKADGSFSQMLNLGTTTQLPENLVDEVNPVIIPNGGSGIITNASGTTLKEISVSSPANVTIHQLDVLPQIGLWDADISGATTTASSGTPAQYKVEIADTDPDYDTNVLIAGTATPNVVESPSNYKLDGTASGAWVDIVGAMNGEGIPTTGVIGGQVYGVYDPVASTVKAAAVGAWVETSKFLQMVASNPTALQALNIPCFAVGATDLRGAGDMAVTGGAINLGSNTDAARGILNATFFAPQSGGKPTIWAAGNSNTYGAGGGGVNGSYTGTPSAGTVGLTGYAPGGSTTNGLSADFILQKFDTGSGKWMATVNNGAGGFNGSSTFRGAAAGAINTVAGTFGGTAAGIAK